MPRPRKELNNETAYELAKIGCTLEEIAGVCGVDVRTVYRRKEEDPEFCQALCNGYAESKMSLRRKQLAQANKGNVAMLIWLGKQFLGQKDKLEQEIGNKDGEPFKSVTADLQNLSTAELMALRDIAQKVNSDTSEPEHTSEPA